MLSLRQVVRHSAIKNHVRCMATAKGGKKKGAEEDTGGIPSEIKKRLKNWVEQILTSTPEPVPIPEHLVGKEEQFLKECQARFDIRARERSKYEQAKIILKLRAIDALPAELKEEAMKVDYSLWPLTIPTPTSSPPSEEWLLDHYRIVELDNFYQQQD